MTKCIMCQSEMDPMEATYSYYCRKCRRYVPKSEWQIPTYISPPIPNKKRKKERKRKRKTNERPFPDIDRFFTDDDINDDSDDYDGFQICPIPD